MLRLLTAVLGAAVSLAAYGHGGGLDANGCHKQQGAGYHCHGDGSAAKRGGSYSPPSYNRPSPSDSDGTKRSSAARSQFVKANPCPSTGRRGGSCPGYHVDHVVPLACGGADSPGNMQWLSAEANLRKGSMGCRN